MKAISDVSDCTKGKKDVVKQKHTSLLETMKNIGFDNLQNIFWCFFKQPNMLLSYLHEAFWINLVIYLYYQRTVFVFDMTNYARMTPVYVSQMIDLKKRIKERGTRWSAAVFVYQSRECHLHRLVQIIAESKKIGHWKY